jgi:hypothetical protein
MTFVSDRLFYGSLKGSIVDVVDAGVDLLPHFELAAIPLLNGNERPAEWPEVRRRLRAEGIRAERHRGVILLEPGELDHFSQVGMFEGGDELYLCAEWDDEFEAFPGRIASEAQNFAVTTPLGLEEWMIDAGCMLALGDGSSLNYASPDRTLSQKLRARFQVVKV